MSGRHIARPISFELAERNWLAWALIGSLTAVVTMLAWQLLAKGFVARTCLLALAVPILLVIGATVPRSPVHDIAFGALVAGAGLWFLVLGVEMGSAPLLTTSALVALVVPFAGAVLPGLAQKLFVLYAVVAVNLVFHGIDRIDRPIGG